MKVSRENSLNGGENSSLGTSIKKKQNIKKLELLTSLNPEDYETQPHTHFAQKIILIIENASKENEELSSYFLNHKDIKYLKTEAVKLKTKGGINNIDPDIILSVFTVFENNLKIGTTAAIEFDVQDKHGISNSVIEEINVAAEIALTSLLILTSPNIDSKLYLEDLLEEIISFSTYQINKLIHPVLKETKNRNCSTRKHNVRKNFFVTHSHNISEIVALLSELFRLKTFTDDLVLKATTLGLSALFSTIQNLELSSLKLLTSLFSRYYKHRDYILDDIFSMLIEKGNILHPYILCSGEEIQLVTALFMLFIQSTISQQISFLNNNTPFESLIIKVWNATRETIFKFLHNFIRRIIKPEGKLCRGYFDHFIQDLLLILNNPEWPIAEIFLRALCIITPEYLNSSDLNLRSLAADCICNICYIIQKSLKTEIKCEILDNLIKEHLNNNIKVAEKKDLTNYEKMQVFQQILLNYLASQSKHNLACLYARDFYLIQWHQNNYETITNLTKLRMESDYKSDHGNIDKQVREIVKIQQFLKDQILNAQSRKIVKQKNDTIFENIKEIIKFLLPKSKLHNYFNRILLSIINGLKKNDAISIRTKVLKGLSNIINFDPKVLNNSQIEGAVKNLFFDTSPLVRESAIELIGKFIIGNPEFMFTYYDSLMSRILDVSVSVRKRVVKILMDICIEYSELPQVPEILLKVVCRINDEETIQNMIKEFFVKLWFTPVRDTPKLDEDTLVKKISKMIYSINQTNVGSYEVLFTKIFKGDLNRSLKNNIESSENLTLSCHQIVNCLIQTVVQLEKLDCNSKRLSSCMIIISLLAKYHPQLLIPHAQTLQNYLFIECKADEDYKIIISVAEVFTEIIPVMKHPSLLLLSELEEAFVKLIMQQKSDVIMASVTCLSQIFKITKNFKLLRECFGFYYKFIKETKQMMDQKKELFNLNEIKKSLNRSLFVIGILVYRFDFNDPEISENTFSGHFKYEIIETVLYFSNCDFDTQLCALKSIGFICSRYSELLLDIKIKSLYINNLTKETTPFQNKVQVLNNLEHFLFHEDHKFQKQNETQRAYKEKIKNLEDVHLGMASTIIQQYLDSILECLFNIKSSVRYEALKVIQLILIQGLIDPLQLVPHLIAVCTDENIKVMSFSEKLLLNIEEKFPGYIYLSAHKGLCLSFKFQKSLTGDNLIRGWRLIQGHTKPNALNSFLYAQLKSRQQVRSFLLSLIKRFDEHSKISIEQMLYIADNLAYFPYKFHEEPMYIIYQIDTILSISGSSMLQMFCENLLPTENEIKEELSESTDDENIEQEQAILKRFPKDITPLMKCIQLARGCQLLGILKQHLRTMYNINLWKMKEYSPSSVNKALINKQAMVKVKTNYFIPENIIKLILTNVSELSHSSLVKEYLGIKKLINDLDIDVHQKRVRIESSKCSTPISISSPLECKIKRSSFPRESNGTVVNEITNEHLNSSSMEIPPPVTIKESKKNQICMQISSQVSSLKIVESLNNFPNESLLDKTIIKSQSENSSKDKNDVHLIKVSNNEQKKNVLSPETLPANNLPDKSTNNHQTKSPPLKKKSKKTLEQKNTQESTPKTSKEGRTQKKSHKRSVDESKTRQFEQKNSKVASPKDTFPNSLQDKPKSKCQRKQSLNDSSLSSFEQNKISFVSSQEEFVQLQEALPNKSPEEDCTLRMHKNKRLSISCLSPERKDLKKSELGRQKNRLQSSRDTKPQIELAGLIRPQESLSVASQVQALSKPQRKRSSEGSVFPTCEQPKKKILKTKMIMNDVITNLN